MRSVTIGILLYNNNKHEIFRCLDGIRHQSHINQILEVLIRDQGEESSEEAVEEWRKKNISGPDIKYHRGENVGFGGGHNILFDKSDAKSIAYLCMNPDGFMHINCVAEMLKIAEKTNYLGIYDSLQEPIMHPKHFDPNTGVTEWCSAACVLIPSSIYKAISGFDDDFFLYCEDVDLSWRVKALGFSCYTCKEAKYFHYAIDRSSRNLDLWRSAAILSYKWRAEKFKTIAFEHLKTIYDLDPNLIEEEFSKLKKHSLTSIYRAKPNFQNMFHFSRSMWS